MPISKIQNKLSSTQVCYESRFNEVTNFSKSSKNLKTILVKTRNRFNHQA